MNLYLNLLLLLFLSNLMLLEAASIGPKILQRQLRSLTDNFTVQFNIVHGDILVRTRMYNDSGNSTKKRRFQASSAIQTDDFLWPQGIIPFEIDPEMESQRCLIQTAMLQIMMNSCIRFRAKTDADFYYATIQQSGQGCFGSVGRNADFPIAVVNLAAGCYHLGTVIHELMHVIGFNHLQMRQDRNQYIRVYPENIDPKNLEQFATNDPRSERILTPWDYQSIMLYGPKAFSKNGRSISMEATQPGVSIKEVSEKPGLTRLDVAAIRQLYNCDSKQSKSNFVDEPQFKEWLRGTDKVCPDDADFSILLHFQ